MAQGSAFFSGASGDPINSKRQLARQSCLNQSDVLLAAAGSTHVDTLMNGGVITYEKQLIDQLKIIAGGIAPQKLDGKTIIPAFNFSFGDVDPADPGMVMLIANLMESYEITSLGGGTQSRWEFARSALGAPVSADPYLELIEDTDVLMRMRILNALVGSLEITGEPNGNLALVAGAVASRFDFWGEPVTRVQTGTADRPTILGDYSVSSAGSDAWDGSPVGTPFNENNSLWLQVNAAPAAGVVQFVARIDAAGPGLPTFVGDAPFDVPVGNTGGARIILDGSVNLGVFSRQGIVTVPATAITSMQNGDTFEVPLLRPALTQSLPTSRSISSVNAQLYRGSTLLSSEGGFTVGVAQSTVEVVQDTGGEQGGVPRRRGFLVPTIEVNREIIDLEMQAALARKEGVPLVLEAQSNIAIPGATNSDPYTFRVVMPEAKPQGPAYGIEEGGQNTQETITFEGGQPTGAAFEFPAGSGETYQSHVHMVVKTDFDATAI